MHELSVTQCIVEACSERSEGVRVLRVTVEVGALSCVMPGALRSCYEIAAQATSLEGSELEIIRIPARSSCRDCGADVDVYDSLRGCSCGSLNMTPPEGGDGLRIRSMEIAKDIAEEIS
jgi:hydrogenase nickel incorporation protein HypA/HybF